MTSAITPFQPEIPLTVPQDVVTNGCWLSDDARRLGMHIMGAPGSGKSRLAGRLLCPVDFFRGFPQVILDPKGDTIDNFLDRLICLPPAWQEKLWPRIRYTDLYATDYIDPKPYFYRLRPDEPYATTAGRFIEVIKATDPALRNAGVEGLNPVIGLGTATAMLAAGLNLQMTAVVDFIHHPEQWLPRVTAAFSANPEFSLALAEFRSFEKLSPEGRRRRSGTLLTKIQPKLFDPALQALLASSRPGLTMDQVDQQCLTWLIDGRHLPAAHKQELLNWLLRYLLDYFNHRHVTGRHRPIGLVLDELTQFLGFNEEQNEAMASIIEELISVVARGYGVNLQCLHQSLVQISSERIRAALMSMGTQSIGRLSAPQDRLYLADQFLQYDPYKVKKEIPTYFNMAYPETIGYGHFAQILMMPNPQIIDYTTEEYSIDEQRLLLADRFRKLERFSFLVRPATAEGAVSDELIEMTIEPFDDGRYPHPEQIADVRRQLRERDGYPVAQLLAEIEQKRQETIAVQTKPPAAKPSKPAGKDKTNRGTLRKGDPAHEPASHSLPRTGPQNTPSAWTQRAPQSPADGA